MERLQNAINLINAVEKRAQDIANPIIAQAARERIAKEIQNDCQAAATLVEDYMNDDGEAESADLDE